MTDEPGTTDAGRERPDPDHPEHHHPEHHHPDGTAPFLPDAWWGMSLLRRREVALGIVIALVLCAGFVGYLVLGDDGGSGSEDAAAEASATTAAPGAAAGAATSTTSAVDASAYVASMSQQRVATFNSIAQCEASGDWSDDTGNGFYGGLQFTLESWETVGGSGNPAQASQDEQIMRADMLEQLQGWVAWPECAAELGLT